MTTPGFDVVLAAARALEARPFFAGAGSTTTVITDGSYSSLSQSDNQWRGGALLAKTAGAGSNQISTVTASTPANVTVSPGLAAAPNEGDLLYVIGPNFPPPVLLSKLAEALLEYGDAVSVDTSLTTVAGQREYTIPAITTGRRDTIEVETARINTSPTVYDLDPGARVDLERGIIILDYDPHPGLAIRLRLRDSVPANITLASLSSVTIPAHIPPDWLALEVAARCAVWRLNQAGDDNAKITQMVNDLRARADALGKRRRPQSRSYMTTLAFTDQR